MTVHTFEPMSSDHPDYPKLAINGRTWNAERCSTCGAWRARFHPHQSWMGPKLPTCEEYTVLKIMRS